LNNGITKITEKGLGLARPLAVFKKMPAQAWWRTTSLSDIVFMVGKLVPSARETASDLTEGKRVPL
jgi:hypothetical protein